MRNNVFHEPLFSFSLSLSLFILSKQHSTCGRDELMRSCLKKKERKLKVSRRAFHDEVKTSGMRMSFALWCFKESEREAVAAAMAFDCKVEIETPDVEVV